MYSIYVFLTEIFGIKRFECLHHVLSCSCNFFLSFIQKNYCRSFSSLLNLWNKKVIWKVIMNQMNRNGFQNFNSGLMAKSWKINEYSRVYGISHQFMEFSSIECVLWTDFSNQIPNCQKLSGSVSNLKPLPQLLVFASSPLETPAFRNKFKNKALLNGTSIWITRITTKHLNRTDGDHSLNILINKVYSFPSSNAPFRTCISHFKIPLDHYIHHSCNLSHQLFLLRIFRTVIPVFETEIQESCVTWSDSYPK